MTERTVPCGDVPSAHPHRAPRKGRAVWRVLSATVATAVTITSLSVAWTALRDTRQTAVVDAAMSYLGTLQALCAAAVPPVDLGGADRIQERLLEDAGSLGRGEYANWLHSYDEARRKAMTERIRLLDGAKKLGASGVFTATTEQLADDLTTLLAIIDAQFTISDCVLSTSASTSWKCNELRRHFDAVHSISGQSYPIYNRRDFDNLIRDYFTNHLSDAWRPSLAADEGEGLDKALGLLEARHKLTSGSPRPSVP